MKARALMLAADMPSWSWGDAINAACYLHRLIPQRGLNRKSPYELMFPEESSGNNCCSSRIKHLRVFGCVAYRWLHAAQRDGGKWVARANPCMFLGYTPSKTIYRLYDFVTKKFYEGSSVSFREDLKAWPLFGEKELTDNDTIFEDVEDLGDNEFQDLKSHERALISSIEPMSLAANNKDSTNIGTFNSSNHTDDQAVPSAFLLSLASLL